jgi:hypothetical protein
VLCQRAVGAVKASAEPCQGYRLTKAGVGKMLDDGAADDGAARPLLDHRRRVRARRRRPRLGLGGASLSQKKTTAAVVVKFVLPFWRGSGPGSSDTLAEWP